MHGPSLTGRTPVFVRYPIPFSGEACYNTGMETGRRTSRRKTEGPGSTLPQKDTSGEQGTEQMSDDNCRCKEVSEKRFTEMLRLMLNDLAFWKKDRPRR